ncbi:S1C family serine protease [Pseudarthrobacter sp. NamE2]|uniref:S1C family serine protease n=1 Tax=Pseudarthrobacter sp. NamE2 TaxID=2576838 RepID=UPI0014859D4A|nr:S1C family serine protease [Pseudarthrobacter sp. NamE2]
MQPHQKNHLSGSPAAWLAVIVLVVTGCAGNGTPNQNQTSEASHAANPTAAATDVPHHSEGGLKVGDPLPQGDAHPATLTPQEVYAVGEKSVFAIEGRRADDFVGTGTGWVIDEASGNAVTNAHVVQGMTAISGRFNNGDKASLHVVAADPCTDLAVVHFSAMPEVAESLILGKSADVKPGDSVTVLGFPGTLTNNPSEQKLIITAGLVNATKVPARPQGAPEFKDTIQHGATINYGNSGGPLLDHHGRVIGINTLTNFGSQNAPAQGQFYSISIDSAKTEIVEKLMKGQSQNDLGWAADEYYPGYFSTLDQARGPALDARLASQGIKGGLYVKAVAPGSEAQKAGISAGMLITKIQSTSTSTIAEMCAIAQSILPGTAVEVDGLHLLASNGEHFSTSFHVTFTAPGKH